MWQAKYASTVPKNLGSGVNFWPCSEGYIFPLWAFLVRGMCYSMHWMILVVEFTSIFSHSCLFVFSFCGFSSAEFLLPFFSCSRSLPLKSPTFLGENIIIWVKTSSFKWWFFHLISLLKEKRCHFLTFIWQLESKRARVRGKRNHEFRT